MYFHIHNSKYKMFWKYTWQLFCGAKSTIQTFTYLFFPPISSLPSSQPQITLAKTNAATRVNTVVWRSLGPGTEMDLSLTTQSACLEADALTGCFLHNNCCITRQHTCMMHAILLFLISKYRWDKFCPWISMLGPHWSQAVELTVMCPRAEFVPSVIKKENCLVDK